MRNIVIYIGSFFLPDKSAGAQRALSLSKSFRDLHYEVILVGMDEEMHDDISILDSKNTCDGFETYAISKPTSLKDWVHHTISIADYKVLMEHIGIAKIFAVVTMEYEAIPLWKLSTYCKKNSIALIADAEEWYGHSKLKFPMNIAKDIDTFIRMHYVYPKHIDNMICISRFFEKHYANDVKNLVYIPGTIDTKQEKWLNLPNYEPNRILTIGYAGHPGMHFEKERLDWLVISVIELNKEGVPCNLHIAGVDKSFLESRMHVKLDKFIFCYGKVSHQECLAMLAICDFTTIVRENKRVTKAGFPTKFSESFGCGTPVITTASSNLQEYIVENETGFLCDGFSIESLKNSIKKASCISKHNLSDIHRGLRERNALTYERFTADLEKFINIIQARKNS